MTFLKKHNELLFIKFPFLFPLLYGIFLYIFPEYELHILFFAILFLAEPHFGATWPFFLNRLNMPYIGEKKFLFVYMPFFVAILSRSHDREVIKLSVYLYSNYCNQGHAVNTLKRQGFI